MSQHSSKQENSQTPNNEGAHRHRGSRRHSRTKRSRLKRYIEWAKNNSIKFVALVFSVALIYISILFFTYDTGKENLDDKQKITNGNNPVKGILLPMRIFNENSPLRIKFGGKENAGIAGPFESIVPLTELSREYVISPMSFISCANEAKVEDPIKLILSVEGNRLFVSTDFKNLYNDRALYNNEIAGSVDKNHWRLLSKNIAAFHSNDDLFEVIDNRGNVIFNMHFNEPNLLLINGYFVGTKCIYITGDSGIHAEPKVGNYIERSLAEIRNIKKIFTYK